MKIYSVEALAALEAGDAVVSGAVAIECDPPVRVFGGFGTVEIDGQPYDGIGDRGLVQLSEAALGGSAQNVTLTLSGVDPEALDLLDAEEVRGAAVTLRRLVCDSAGRTILDAQVFRRGRIDQLPTEDVIGGEATIKAMVEGAARGLGRRGGRMRTDADQRMIKELDGGLKHVSYAAEKTLYWGGKQPARAGSVLSQAITKLFQPKNGSAD